MRYYSNAEQWTEKKDVWNRVTSQSTDIMGSICFTSAESSSQKAELLAWYTDQSLTDKNSYLLQTQIHLHHLQTLFRKRRPSEWSYVSIAVATFKYEYMLDFIREATLTGTVLLPCFNARLLPESSHCYSLERQVPFTRSHRWYLTV